MINLRVSGFDWDEGDRAKCQKHGVSIAHIEALFAHSPRIAPAPKHSADEDRLIAVGRTSTGRPVFVAFTLRPMKKKVPRLKTDKQAEAFLAQDLSSLDFSQFKSARFEFEKKDEQINMRVPRPLLAAVKARAKARGIPYTRFIRETLERAIVAPK